MNANVHLTKLGHAKATWCKPISNFCKQHKQIRICEKVFYLKKIISLKYSGVRSCFEAFIATNITVQSDFDFNAWFETVIFLFQNYMHACLFFFLPLTSHACTTGRPHGTSSLCPAISRIPYKFASTPAIALNSNLYYGALYRPSRNGGVVLEASPK